MQTASIIGAAAWSVRQAHSVGANKKLALLSGRWVHRVEDQDLGDRKGVNGFLLMEMKTKKIRLKERAEILIDYSDHKLINTSSWQFELTV